MTAARPNAEKHSRELSGRLLISASLSALIRCAMPSAAAGADRYWDGNGTAVGSGGTGTWNLGNLNWSPNGDGVSGPYSTPWSNAALDNAIFAGTAGTVTLGVPITVQDRKSTSELQSLMRISYAVFCLKKKNHQNTLTHQHNDHTHTANDNK